MSETQPAPDDWLNRKQAAIYLTKIGCPVSATGLAKRAMKNNQGKGPPFNVIGDALVRYQRRDLDAWAQARMRRVA